MGEILFVLVDYIPCWICFMCPFCISLDLGKSFATLATVSAGNMVRLPLQIAEIKVVLVENPSAAWN